MEVWREGRRKQKSGLDCEQADSSFLNHGQNNGNIYVETTQGVCESCVEGEAGDASPICYQDSPSPRTH
jgi:hypothetical protein